MSDKIRVTVWNEFHDDQRHSSITDMYPGGLQCEIGRMLEGCADMDVRLRTLFDAEQGLPLEELAQTDVLIFYSHSKQHAIERERCLLYTSI